MIRSKDPWARIANIIESRAIKTITVKYDGKARVYVGYCKLLDLYSQGTNWFQAKRATKSAIRSFLKINYERATLNQVIVKYCPYGVINLIDTRA